MKKLRLGGKDRRALLSFAKRAHIALSKNDEQILHIHRIQSLDYIIKTLNSNNFVTEDLLAAITEVVEYLDERELCSNGYPSIGETTRRIIQKLFGPQLGAY